jgi:hypothetical protein
MSKGSELKKKERGRPVKFETEQELHDAIVKYFEKCKQTGDVPTVCGLAVDLNTSRETLCNYEKKEDYFDTIKKAKTIIASIQEQMALQGKLNPTVWIFSAKNNLGYTDKQEFHNTGNMDNNIIIKFE